MNYDQFLAEDFLMDESFQQYCLGVNEEAVKFWTNWIKANEQKENEIAKAKELYFILNGSNSSERFGKHKAALINRLMREKIDTDVKVILLPVRRRIKISILRFAAAAAVIIVLGVGALFVFRKGGSEIIQSNNATVIHKSDVAPGGDKAILTLADGRTIILDSIANGAITNEAGINVIKLDGQLAYNQESTTTEVLYNTVTTPKGGQYQLVLADGSKVWLNAASSLRFPTAFTGADRQVELTGEGYFEVNHNVDKPFHVKVNDMDIQDWGTHFNINGYNDEPTIKTTLLEGKVKLTKNDKYVLLNPGQQAIVNPSDNSIRVADGVNVEEVVAWKNGKFLFDHADIQTIMRQAARWYNVSVVYSKSTSETFSGGIPRKENISQLLKIFEATGKVAFTIDGGQVTVKPK